MLHETNFSESDEVFNESFSGKLTLTTDNVHFVEENSEPKIIKLDSGKLGAIQISGNQLYSVRFGFLHKSGKIEDTQIAFMKKDGGGATQICNSKGEDGDPKNHAIDPKVQAGTRYYLFGMSYDREPINVLVSVRPA